MDEFILGFLIAVILEYFYSKIKIKINELHEQHRDDETEILEIETKIINFYVISELISLCALGIGLLVGINL